MDEQATTFRLKVNPQAQRQLAVETNPWTTEVEVEGWVKDGLAVHLHVLLGNANQPVYGWEYAVSHVASGLSIVNQIGTRIEAMDIRDRLLGMGVEWMVRDPKADEERLGYRVEAIVEAAKRERNDA